MLRSRSFASLALAVASLATLNACGTDLGPCDMTKATEVVYKRGPNRTGCKVAAGCDNSDTDPTNDQTLVTFYLPYTSGQALAHSSCGNGGVCHSKAATGALRHGAPKGLDFDLAVTAGVVDTSAVLADPKGHDNLVEWIETSWTLIDDGSMPPGAIGRAVQSASKWFSDVNAALPAPTEASLPTLSTPEGKEIMRNWLACGAPVVNGNVEAGQRGPDEVPPTWDAIHEVLISGTCTQCHAFVADPGANGALLLTDACASWKSLVDRAPSNGGMCGSFQGALVTPGNPDASLLMQKLDADPLASPSEVCGFPMPLFENRLSALDRDSIRAWITNGALPPRGCN